MSPPVAPRRRDVRVAVVSSAHAWSDNRVHLREAASLAEAGYNVHLVAIDHAIDVPETGVETILMPKLSRWKRLTLGSLRAVIAGLRLRPHIVHLHDPELVWAVPLLRVIGKTVVYDAHEDLPAQVMGKHYLPDKLRHAAVLFSRGVVKAASLSNGVIAATEAIAATFGRGAIVVHNYPRLDLALEPKSVQDRATKVVYVGALSIIRGAEQMIDAFADDQFPSGWRVDVAGSTAPAALLESLKERAGWSRVEFLGQIAPAEARQCISESRVGLVLFQRSQAHLESLPTKMFEYFAEGVPVVASDFPLWREIIESHDCGLLVDETDPAAIARAIRRYADDPELLERHARNARKAAEDTLNWGAEEGVLIDLYDRLAFPKPRSVRGR